MIYIYLKKFSFKVEINNIFSYTLNQKGLNYFKNVMKSE